MKATYQIVAITFVGEILLTMFSFFRLIWIQYSKMKNCSRRILLAVESKPVSILSFLRLIFLHNPLQNPPSPSLALFVLFPLSDSSNLTHLFHSLNFSLKFATWLLLAPPPLQLCSQHDPSSSSPPSTHLPTWPLLTPFPLPLRTKRHLGPLRFSTGWWWLR